MRAAEVRATDDEGRGGRHRVVPGNRGALRPGARRAGAPRPAARGAASSGPSSRRRSSRRRRCSSGQEHAAAMARLGLLRMQRLRDVDGAIEAFDEALAFDSADKTARSTLEKLAALGRPPPPGGARARAGLPARRGDRRRSSSSSSCAARWRESVEDRLAALREASDLAAGAGAAEAARAVDVVGRGLAEAVAGGQPLREWLDRLDRVAGSGTDPKKRAAILGKAIGDREVTSDELRGAGEARGRGPRRERRRPGGHRAVPPRAGVRAPLGGAALAHRRSAPRPGQPARARRPLPRGDPAGGRRAATGAAAPHRRDRAARPRRREAAPSRRTARALDDDADDADAYAALAELYAQAGHWADLVRPARGPARPRGRRRGAGRRAHASRRSPPSTATRSGRATQCARLLEDPRLAPEHLDAVERAADRLGDADLARAVLHRRAEMAQDPREQIAWLDSLGELDEDRRGDLDAAATAWKRAGGLAESIGDEEAARRLTGARARWRPRTAR